MIKSVDMHTKYYPEITLWMQHENHEPVLLYNTLPKCSVFLFSIHCNKKKPSGVHIGHLDKTYA